MNSPQPALPLIPFLDQHVSRSLQEDILVRCLIKGYADSAVKCLESYSTEQAHDLRPQMRRADIEQLLRGLPGRHSDVIAVPEINVSNNAWHVRLTSGRITLTVSAVDGPENVVREAVFRRNLARRYQMGFSGDGWESPTPIRPTTTDDDLVYGLVIHGPAKHDTVQRFPAFVHIVFPVEDCTTYYIDRLDLLARFREHPVIKEVIGQEEVPDDLDLRIRDLPKEKDDA